MSCSCQPPEKIATSPTRASYRISSASYPWTTLSVLESWAFLDRGCCIEEAGGGPCLRRCVIKGPSKQVESACLSVTEMLIGWAVKE